MADCSHGGAAAAVQTPLDAPVPIHQALQSNVSGCPMSLLWLWGSSALGFDSTRSLSGKGTEINNVKDMYGMTIEAYPDATEVLPLRDLPDRSRYHEHSSKGSQVILLYRGKIDVLIMESSFFDYFRSKVKSLIDDSMTVEKRNLFPPVDYKIACHDESLRDEFNKGLDQLRRENGITLLYVKYLNPE